MSEADTFGGTLAVVLAGGLGTRLRSAVSDRPKVLAPVSGRPFLAYLLDRLESAGLRRTVLCIGHLGDQVIEAFRDRHGRMSLCYTREESLLGTGGALRLALSRLTSETRLLVLNGDSHFDTDLLSFARGHRAEESRATLALARLEDTRRFGRVELDETGLIAAFREKGEDSGPGLINAGIYLLDPSLVAEIPARRAVSLEREIFPGWVQRRILRGHPGEGAFLDIGTPEAYARAEEHLSTALVEAGR